MITEKEIININNKFEKEKPEAILRWAWENFQPDIAATSSFQTQSMPLLHIISQVVPELPILFLDTGFHFPETLMFRDRVTQELGLKLLNIKSDSLTQRTKEIKNILYQNNPDLCCFINKVKPLKDAKLSLKAWITGIRRDQTQTRADTKIISLDKDGLFKICPMATWSRKDIWIYCHQQKLLEHPLMGQGYLSIGCEPCTRPIFNGESERDGRWAGQNKVECGIHIFDSIQQEDIKK